MNITFLSRLFHPHIGGVESHVGGLCSTLVSRGHQLTLITSQHDTSLSLKENYKKITILRIPNHKLHSKFQIWNWIKSNQKLLLNSDIVHSHDVFWWCLPFKLTNNKKLIFTTFHGWEGTFPPSAKAKISRKISEHFSHKNICVGDFIKKWYGTKPDLVTYGATSIKPLPPGDVNKILVLGRLSHDNDAQIVIDGLSRVLKGNKKIKITFLGDGECAWEASKIGNVLGFREDIKPHLEEVAWVVSSSYLSILDAMAAGRKIFSVYSNPLKKDYLHMHPGSNWLSISGTSDQLVTRFQKLHSDPIAIRTSVLKAQKWAQKQTWEKMANTYLRIWEKK